MERENGAPFTYEKLSIPPIEFVTDDCEMQLGHERNINSNQSTESEQIKGNGKKLLGIQMCWKLLLVSRLFGMMLLFLGTFCHFGKKRSSMTL